MRIATTAHGLTVCSAVPGDRPWRGFGIGWNKDAVGFTSYTVRGGVARSATFQVSRRLGIYWQWRRWSTAAEGR